MFNEDFLIKTAASLLGMSPQIAREHFAKLQQWNVDAIQGFDSRIRRIESELALQNRLLLAIAAQLGVNENGTDESNAANGNVLAIAERVANAQ